MIKRIIKKIISKLKNDTLDYNDFEKYKMCIRDRQ